MTTDLILGTAGHIDHGKTSLIRALTGVDTDRLPEEKRRGITIELGFAELALGDYRLGIVDVPGHERFVRHMLAGATSMDVAMLVVAADDSVKQQTREHLDILRLLDLPAGVIALTKCDLADADWVDLVSEEVRELVADSFLAQAPIVRTSATTGAGLDELRSALAAAAEKSNTARSRLLGAPFRMAIDRTFTVAGHGTVVTGSVASGSTRTGDTLLLQPGGREVRVRGLQNHDRAVEAIQRGQRAAINLAGVHHNEIHRGHELSSPGFLKASRLITVNVSLLPTAPRPLKDRQRLRLHVGTAETLASVRLLNSDQIAPGSTGYAQLFLREPVVATWNQPLVLRSESPVTTIGGGHILDPTAERIRHPHKVVIGLLEDLSSHDEPTRAGAALYFAGLRGWQASDLARSAGIEDGNRFEQDLAQRGDLQRLEVTRGKTMLLHNQRLQEVFDHFAAVLAKMHEQNPLVSSHPRATIANRFQWLGEPALIEAILQHMQRSGRVRLTDQRVALKGHGPKLSRGEQTLLDQLIEKYRESGFQPPTVQQVKKETDKHRESVPQLIELAAAEGQLVEFAQGLFLHADCESQLRVSLAEAMSQGGMTVSEIREQLGTTRKFAVPLCEYLDRIGFTKREGDLRTLAQSAAAK